MFNFPSNNLNSHFLHMQIQRKSSQKVRISYIRLKN